MFHVVSPVEGRCHYMTLFRHSGVSDALNDSLVIQGRPFFIYGYPSYVLRAFMQIGFARGTLTATHLSFNKGIAEVHIIMEWAL